MKQNGRGNALLVELLIVVLFFMLASTTLMQIFGAAKENSNRAAACSAALLEGQNLAEQLYAADDVALSLASLGFEATEQGWRKTYGSYDLVVAYGEKSQDAGILREASVCAEYGGEMLFTLPATRYIPGEVAQ